MPTLTTEEAAEKIAGVVERSKPNDLREILAELFPESSSLAPQAAGDVARYIRGGLAAEELVDLWNVVFPDDRNVWYDEGEQAIHYNEEMVGYAD